MRLNDPPLFLQVKLTSQSNSLLTNIEPRADSICPGRHFSKDGQFLMISSLLATFTLTAEKDEQGGVVPMQLDMTNPILK